jgi:SAM-dependent methyltransferase
MHGLQQPPVLTGPSPALAQESYCAMVAAIEQKNVPPGGEAMMRAIIRAVPRRDRRIIDLGCNTGWVARQLTRAFPGAEVIGVDPHPGMIRSASAIAEREGLSIRFETLDGGRMRELGVEADAIVCGGSAAFFLDPASVYREAASCLAAGGVMIDCHYIYSGAASEELRLRERASFGLGWTPSGPADIVAVYEEAGLVLRRARRFKPFFFPDKPKAALFRSILRNDPALRELVDGLAARRALIGELSPHRAPCLFVAGRGPARAHRRRKMDIRKTAAVMDLFSAPVPVRPMKALRRMRPYAFLAYVGDPDAAPGGGKAVAEAADMLKEGGVPQHGAVLDIGCFSGLSSIILASRFDHVTGIDIDRSVLRTARAVAGALGSCVRWRRLDGARTPYPAGAFDAVAMTATLAYTPDPDAMIAECMRLLKPGGLLVEFLYHHFAIGGEAQRSIRRAVGPDIVTAPLSAKLRPFETAGFALERLEVAPTGSAGAAEQRAVQAYAVARERARDPAKTPAELAEFAELFALYTGRLSPDGPKPVAYRALFRKPGP